MAYTCTCILPWDGPTCEKGLGTLPDTTANCPEETFLDLSLWPGPGGSYPDPELTINCSGNTMTVTSNNMIHYQFVQVSPFDLVETQRVGQVPLTKAWNDPPIDAAVVGEIGVTVGGLPIGTPSASNMLKYADPAAEEVTDSCEGHTNGMGYHYHSVNELCFFVDDVGNTRSTIVGWMYDGYPIFGPYECTDDTCATIMEMKSSWVVTGNPSECAWQNHTYMGAASGEESDGDEYLDECNGHFGPYGDYHYHITNGYPWVSRCFRGNPSMSGNVYGGPADQTFLTHCTDGVYSP
jgi:hypothetical protein